MYRLTTERLALYMIGVAAGVLALTGAVALLLIRAPTYVRLSSMMAVVGVGLAVLVVGALAIVRREAERKNAMTVRIRDLAFTDALTHLPNVRSFDAALANACSELRRNRRPFAVVAADLDHFRRVNDAYGHPVGDEVLRSAAKRLRAELRDGDEIARVGGEEFALILHDVGDAGARSVVERLRTALSAEEFLGRNSNGVVIALRLTMSFGVATATTHEEATRRDLRNRADAALYRAKRRGRNRIEVADPNAIAERVG